MRFWRGGAPEIYIALTIACAFVMQQMDTILLALAIPSIGRDFDVSPVAVHLAATSYILGLAVFMPISGWFANRFGAKRVFNVAIVIFSIGSVLSGISLNLPAMVAARLFQGFGGAMMIPVGRVIVLKAFGTDRRLDAQIWLTLPSLIGALIGPLIGALILTVASWHWIFFVNLPLCVVLLTLVRRFVPDMPALGAGRFDWRGFGIIASGLTLFQLLVEHLAHPVFGAVGTGALLISSVTLFWIYRRHATGHASPALDLSPFRNPAFKMGVIVGGIGRIGINSLTLLLPLFLQQALGFSVMKTGLIIAASGLGTLASKPVLKPALERWGYPVVIAGLSVTATAVMVTLAGVRPELPVAVIVFAVIAAGAIRRLHFTAVNTLTYSKIEDHDLPHAVATAGVFQQMFMGLGISFAAVALSHVGPTATQAPVENFPHVFILMGVIPLLALPILWRLTLQAGKGR